MLEFFLDSAINKKIEIDKNYYVQRLIGFVIFEFRFLIIISIA